MAKIEKFEDIIAWQEARNIVNKVNKVCRVIEQNKDYALSEQMKRASISIMANIAEGFGRRTPKEFAQFLFTSKASASELQSHLYIALDQKCLGKEEFNELYKNLEYIQRLISNFIKYLRNGNSTLQTQ
ncbi:MAG: four helix bundle protein [Nitrospirae bacterium]|nr:four helix bundle protein [Nitrospirota bacterium]